MWKWMVDSTTSHDNDELVQAPVDMHELITPPSRLASKSYLIHSTRN
jgi:hypothetical protein